MGLIREINRNETKYQKALERLAGIALDDEIKRLEPEQIEIIHNEMIAKFGGLYGIRDNGLFLSLCTAPFQECFGEELYPTLFEKAAKYLESFARYQVFLDGNKRTGFTTMCVFLGINGYEFDMGNIEAEKFVLDIANGKYKELQEIAEIIIENSVYVKEFSTNHMIEDKEER